MQRNGQKRDKENLMGKDDRDFFLFLSTFSAKSFLHKLSQKSFCGVFELPLLRNAQKRHKNNLKTLINKKRKAPTYLI
jgi:hypothetical protein